MADVFEIYAAIESLELHFRNPLQGEVRTKWLADWFRDLREYEAKQIQEGCAYWRRHGEKFPKPGELIRVIRNAAPLTGKKGDGEPWRDLGEDEYRTLSVRDKIRHHQIKACEAGRRAGPMFRNTTVLGGKPMGDHLTPEEMPETWHHWNRERKFHDERVRELRLVVNRPEAPRMAALPRPQVQDDVGEVL